MRPYVLNKYGEPLMPCKPRKARLLLKNDKAKVVSREPFTIQLKYGSSGYKQDITVGVDTGFSKVGVSVLIKAKELNSYEFEMRTDISKKITQRRQYRRIRRGRLRYRKPRFDNRSSSKKKGRLAPSVQWRVDAHKRLIDTIRCRLPENTLILETASFDIQKLNNPDITNEQYQKGVQYGYANTRAYVLDRDNHTCQAGKNGCKEELHVHHLKFKSNGGSDRPSNLITLCSKHHKQLHDGKLNKDFTPKDKGYKAASVMSVVRKRLLQNYPDAIETFGYVTKENRFKYGISKSHTNDAFVIAGGTGQQRQDTQVWKFKRTNNRSLQKNRKGYGRSVRKNRYPLQPKDIVEFEGNRFKVNGTHNKGSRCIIWIDGKKESKSVKDLNLIYHTNSIFNKEMRMQAHSSHPQQS